jgi:ATP-dependent DNA helicase RecG
LFKEMGLIDELGSGIRNLYKYSKLYFGEDPHLIEGDIFRLSIPYQQFEKVAQVTPQVTPQDTPQVTPQVDERTEKILNYCEVPRTRNEIQTFVGILDREYFRKSILVPLIQTGLIQLTIPEKPTSSKQKYYHTKK